MNGSECVSIQEWEDKCLLLYTYHRMNIIFCTSGESFLFLHDFANRLIKISLKTTNELEAEIGWEATRHQLTKLTSVHRRSHQNLFGFSRGDKKLSYHGIQRFDQRITHGWSLIYCRRRNFDRNWKYSRFVDSCRLLIRRTIWWHLCFFPFHHDEF